MATVQNAATLTDPVTNHITGHGIAPYDNTSWTAKAIADEIVAHNNIEWAVIRWDWRQLETAKGVYATGATAGFAAATTWPFLPKDIFDYFAAHADPAVNACKICILVEDRGFTTGVYNASNITFNSAAKTIASATNSFSGFGAEHRDAFSLLVTGTANNNDIFTVASTSAGNPITVNEALTNETPASCTVRQILVPDYMVDNDYYIDTGIPGFLNTTGARYREYYYDRMGDCFDAICDAFRAEPNFGGLASAETSMGNGYTGTSDFTQASMQAGQWKQIQRASRAAKNHVFLWYRNFLGDPTVGDAALNEIIGWMRPYHNVYIAAPDLLEGGNEESRYYPSYTLYPGIIKQHIAIQRDSYSSTDNGGNTMLELFDYANGTNYAGAGKHTGDALNQGATDLIDGIPWTTGDATYHFDPQGVAVIDAYPGPFR